MGIPQSKDAASLVDYIERARQAQQTHVQKHDVQLEISDCDPGDEDDKEREQ